MKPQQTRTLHICGPTWLQRDDQIHVASDAPLTSKDL